MKGMQGSPKSSFVSLSIVLSKSCNAEIPASRMSMSKSSKAASIEVANRSNSWEEKKEKMKQYFLVIKVAKL